MLAFNGATTTQKRHLEGFICSGCLVVQMSTFNSHTFWKQIFCTHDVKDALQQFCHSNFFVVSLLLSVIYLLSGSYSLVLCNVICTLPPGIFTYLQLVNKNGASQGPFITYWIICGISFACDTIYVNTNGYTYVKMLSMSVLFYFIARYYLKTVKSHPKEWTANSRICRSEKTTQDMDGSQQITFDVLKTVSAAETCQAIDLSTARTNPKKDSTACLRSSLSGRNKSMSVTNPDETAELDWKSISVFENSSKKRRIISFGSHSSGDDEGLILYPESQVTIRTGYNGPTILALTNNYKKPVVWAMKTNAIKRLTAFPNAGVIPPLLTVQVKINLVQKMPRNCSKDRLSVEYIPIDSDIKSGIQHSCFLHTNPGRMKKSLKVVYIH